MSKTELVCEIRYRLEASMLDAFRDYARTWMELIERHGGQHYGYLSVTPRARRRAGELSRKGNG